MDFCTTPPAASFKIDCAVGMTSGSAKQSKMKQDRRPKGERLFEDAQRNACAITERKFLWQKTKTKN